MQLSKQTQLWIKRGIDVCVSASALTTLSPVFATVALLEYLFHDGHPIFVQQRIGKDGRGFSIYKFRSMRQDRDKHGALLPDEERLTRFGKILRQTSLDELPEFWNVLRGDMSLVGPRPLLPEYLPHYSARQRKRHQMRPGLTGLAVTLGRNSPSWEERLGADVHYVENFDLALDLKIIGKTIAVIFSREGISHDGHATMPRFDQIKHADTSDKQKD